MCIHTHQCIYNLTDYSTMNCGFSFHRLAYCFYVVCFAASLGMTVFMSMAGAVGGVCGTDRNFTDIMSENDFVILIVSCINITVVPRLCICVHI